MTRYRISPHFTVEEFDCRNGTKVPPAAHDALKLWARVWGEPMRERFGPIRVTSGYRTTAYNKGVGGADLSYHVYSLRYGPNRRPTLGVGVAADVVPATGDVAAWTRWAKAHQPRVAAAIGDRRGAYHGYLSSGFIHLDTGATRSWVG